MKKRIISFLMLFMAVTMLLAACSAAGNDSSSADSSSGGSSWTGSNSESPMNGSTEETTDDASPDGAVVMSTSLTEKIIYSADVEIETLDFDASVEAVEQMVEAYGGFFESSSVSGTSYSSQFYGYGGGRYASYVIRIPVESFNDMTGSLDAVGNVLNLYRYTDNITEQFYDSQSRLETYEIEEERLLAMLEKAETVTDMLDIESRLSQIRYEIESLESRLQNWQNQVDYSTISMNVREVENLTQLQDPDRTYWQQLGDGFVSTLSDVGNFFKDLFRVFVAAIPVLIIIAVIITVLVFIIRGKHKKRKMKREEKAEDSQVENK